ncbi:hypothetical protein EVG20_g4473 [Dentipellis fragilis]|uniref:Uncharacterized protein n=1 Tax=Dentipellis fragilis TaxID=205917 RepID=A0A4Y9YW17_9AGAM|nr:hypothetical protein EVG20_g4473 [Dentipellis fragilis]
MERQPVSTLPQLADLVWTDAGVISYKDHGDIPDQQSISRLLTNFALTAYAFVSPCQSHLFRIIALTGTRYKQFLDILESSALREGSKPGIGRHVRTLILRDSHLFDSALLQLGPLLPQMCHFELQGVHTGLSGFSASALASVTRNNVTHLCISTAFKTFGAFTQTILAFPMITSLTLEGVVVFSSSSETETTKESDGDLRHLSSLHLYILPPASNMFIPWLLALPSPPQSIKQLSMVYQDFTDSSMVESFNALFYAYRESLSSITLLLSQFTEDVFEILDVSPLKRLSYFKLLARFCQFRHAEIAPPLNLLASHPSSPTTRSITHIEFSIELDEEEWQDELFNDPQDSPPETLQQHRERKSIQPDADAILSSSAFDHVQEITVRFPAFMTRTSKDLEFRDNFPKLKAKSEARGPCGDGSGKWKEIDWLVFDKDGYEWVRLQ